MQIQLRKAAAAVRASYWFVPSLMTVAAIALAAFMVWLDVRLGTGWLSDRLGWYQSIKPSGARDVLSTIAGSTLTVAGTAFSITIAAISFASGQFGPRLLTNFMGDRGNTITLGTFVATFVYCLFVLRTVREGPDGDFVPQLAVAVGLALALLSAAMLIYFIHHVPRAIHVNSVIASIGRQLIEGIDRRFPDRIGTPADSDRPVAAFAWPEEPPACVPARGHGYLQAVDQDILLAEAERRDLLIRLHYRPGDFVADGRPLLSAWPAAAAGDELGADLRRAFVLGDERTPSDDLNFLVNELVEIAGRALSSGINDPLTAVTCMDWLGAALGELAGRSLPEPRRCGSDGAVRIVALPDRFETFVDQGLGRLRAYVAHDRIAASHMLRTLGLVAASCRRMLEFEVLDKERLKLIDTVRARMAGADLQDVEDIHDRLQTLLAEGPGEADERGAGWLGGSA